jgi:prolyl-tRNA synthetase
MRMSRLFSQTLRESSADAEVTSHDLLLRAGFIRQLASGIFSYLPLARRSLNKIESIIRNEMEAIDGQELTMPVVHPADIWKETGRWYQVGSEMGRFLDKSNRDMVLAMTHEEVVGDLVRREIKSYRQLPQLIYQIQTKWRDDPRPRAGLIRVREFSMKDSYSLDADWDGLERQYRAHYQIYFNIFGSCGLPTMAVKSDVGMMGGSAAHEFIYLTPIGEDSLVLCDSCGYSANRQVARFKKNNVQDESPAELEKVATPNCTTIAELAEFMGVPESRTAKAVFMVAKIQGDEVGAEEQKFVLAVVRGDMEVNETKLTNALQAKEIRPAQSDEILAVGAVSGYGSAVGLTGALVVADDVIPMSPNLVAGANEDGFHLKNVNYGRDYKVDMVCDIVAAQEGDRCVDCGEPLRISRGVEVGNIFQLGTRYSEALGCNFLNAEGRTKPVIMGSYGIGIGRMLACIAEEHNDEHGLIWPISISPFSVHLVSLAKGDGAVATATEEIYGALNAAAIDTLLDDRMENPGVKFNDADLIGIPVRITIGERSLKKGNVELKLRSEEDRRDIPVEDVVGAAKAVLDSLWSQLRDSVVDVEYRD